MIFTNPSPSASFRTEVARVAPPEYANFHTVNGVTMISLPLRCAGPRHDARATFVRTFAGGEVVLRRPGEGGRSGQHRPDSEPPHAKGYEHRQQRADPPQVCTV